MANVLGSLKAAVEQQAIRDGADQAVGSEKLSRTRTREVVNLLVDYLFQADSSRPDVVWVGYQLAEVRQAALQIFDHVIPRVADTMGLVIDQELSRRLRGALDGA